MHYKNLTFYGKAFYNSLINKGKTKEQALKELLEMDRKKTKAIDKQLCEMLENGFTTENTYLK